MGDAGGSDGAAGASGSLPAPSAGQLESLYESPAFRMHCFKVLPCPQRFAHDWPACPFAHPGERAKRRDPHLFSYTGIACPSMKKEGCCALGDHCPHAHNVFEYWMHPTRYRTQLCSDGAKCPRKICFFAHSLDELRTPACKPFVPAEMVAAAAAAAASAREQRAAAGPAAGAGPASSPPGSLGRQQGLQQEQPNEEQEQQQIVELVVWLLSQGEFTAEQAAILLRHLLPPTAICSLQSELRMGGALPEAAGSPGSGGPDEGARRYSTPMVFSQLHEGAQAAAARLERHSYDGVSPLVGGTVAASLQLLIQHQQQQQHQHMLGPELSAVQQQQLAACLPPVARSPVAPVHPADAAAAALEVQRVLREVAAASGRRMPAESFQPGRMDAGLAGSYEPYEPMMPASSWPAARPSQMGPRMSLDAAALAARAGGAVVVGPGVGMGLPMAPSAAAQRASLDASLARLSMDSAASAFTVGRYSQEFAHRLSQEYNSRLSQEYGGQLGQDYAHRISQDLARMSFESSAAMPPRPPLPPPAVNPFASSFFASSAPPTPAPQAPPGDAGAWPGGAPPRFSA